MVYEVLELVLEPVKAIIYLIAFIMIFKLSKKIYGGKFTSIIPLLAAGCGLLLLQGLVIVTAHFFMGEEIAHMHNFIYGIQTLQITAGVLFASALYQLYKITFATSGFFGEEKPAKGGKK